MNETKQGVHALLITPTKEVLLVTKGKGYLYDTHNAGKVAMFGGGVETGEAMLDALHRELLEELELDIHDKKIVELGVYEKTQEKDGVDVHVHVFIVYDIDRNGLVLHEGDEEDLKNKDSNEQIICEKPEALLQRDDLTRITRLALLDYCENIKKKD